MPQLQNAIARIEAEYQEMPGLVMTGHEAARLLGLDTATCARALAVLIGRRFLKLTPTGGYLRNRRWLSERGQGRVSDSAVQ